MIGPVCTVSVFVLAPQTEWESLGRLHESTLIAPSPSALPSAEDLEAGIASKATELEYLQSQQADLCQLLYALRLDVSSKLDREVIIL